MQSVIWKHPIPDIGKPGFFSVQTPMPMKALHVGIQNGLPWIWGAHRHSNQVNPEVLKHSFFELAWTGRPTWMVDLERDDHVGTFELNGIVWHVFQLQMSETEYRLAHKRIIGVEPTLEKAQRA